MGIHHTTDPKQRWFPRECVIFAEKRTSRHFSTYCVMQPSTMSSRMQVLCLTVMTIAFSGKISLLVTYCGIKSHPGYPPGSAICVDFRLLVTTFIGFTLMIQF